MILDILIESLGEILTVALKMLIGIVGTWIGLQLSKRAELSNVREAQAEVTTMAQITVGELMQTVVTNLKASAADGKLSKEDIMYLNTCLKEQTMEKVSEPTIKLLTAAKVDIAALIAGAGEDWINKLKHL